MAVTAARRPRRRPGRRLLAHDRELGARLAHEPRPVGALRDIARDELPADLARDARAARIDVVHDDARAFFGEAPGDAGAEARAGAGDDRDLVFQPHEASLNGLCSASSFT